MALNRLLRRAASVAALALAAATIPACSDGIDPPTTPIVFVGPDSLQITELRTGSGDTIAAGQTAIVHYGLWLYDPRGADSKGTFVEDSRIGGPTAGINISLRPETVIAGWVQGVPGMKVGGARRLIIPPSLAFGDTGSGPIPPRAWLVFDIDLLGIGQ